MTNHEQDFDPPRIMLVEEVNGRFDFGLLPSDFRYFGSFQMLCAGISVRTGNKGVSPLHLASFDAPGWNDWC